jgi:hypothetical protein
MVAVEKTAGDESKSKEFTAKAQRTPRANAKKRKKKI